MMSAWRSWALALLVGVAFFWGVIGLFNREFASGELYPEFSTLRTDRLGTKLLYDSLNKLPGITVSRNFMPMEFLPRDGVTLVLLGVNPMRVNWNEDLFLRVLERIANRGNRVVVAMHIDTEYNRPKQKDFDRQEEPIPTGTKKKLQSETPQAPPLKTMWKVTFQIDSDEKNPHPLYFGQTEGWRVRDQVGSEKLAIERDFGKGSVVLMAESADFTNQSAVAMDRLRQVAGVLGPSRQIVFDEEHLGIAESGSVVGMARQFRLMGLAFGLGLCAALFIWRNAASFPPSAAPRSVERFSGRTSQAGLLTLLQRHIPPAELAAVCWREWLCTNGGQATPERRKQADAIIAGAAGRPLEATREIQALLHAKGEL
jgi:hypothetical protein